MGRCKGLKGCNDECGFGGLLFYSYLIQGILMVDIADGEKMVPLWGLK